MRKTFLFIVLVCVFSNILFSQQTNTNDPIIFALVFDGTRLDPIAFVKKGKLANVESSVAMKDTREILVSKYYQLLTPYNLIFGGGKNGTVIVEDNHWGDCSGYSAIVKVKSKVKLDQTSPALATNLKIPKTQNNFRRELTFSEKNVVEKLVKAEFKKHRIENKKLNPINLNAIDFNNDKVPEFVGSFYVVTGKKSRGLLFFIAEKSKGRNYSFSLRSFEKIVEKDVMSGNIKDLDEGIYHEILLDAFDFNNDGEKEIFTVGYAFEGNNYFVYKKLNGKWKKIFDTYSYRCGY